MRHTALFALAAALALVAQPAAAARKPEGHGGPIFMGAYECWHFSSARLDLNFNIQAGGKYKGADGKAGTYVYDPASGKATFKGGALSGQTVWYILAAGDNRPEFDFRNAHGDQTDFCQPAKWP